MMIRGLPGQRPREGTMDQTNRTQTQTDAQTETDAQRWERRIKAAEAANRHTSSAQDERDELKAQETMARRTLTTLIATTRRQDD